MKNKIGFNKNQPIVEHNTRPRVSNRLTLLIIWQDISGILLVWLARAIHPSLVASIGVALNLNPSGGIRGVVGV